MDKIDEIIKQLNGILPKTPVFNILLTDKKVSPTNSKLGGDFYWPDENIPQEVQFLAQINFRELPTNDIFPKHGLLQFFIGNDAVWGLDDQNFKVVYHKNILSTYFTGNTMNLDSPIIKEASIKFKFKEEFLSLSDYRFNILLEQHDIDIEDIWDAIFNIYEGSGHKLLGYPFFTQYDPREYDQNNRVYDTLLLQLDSDNEFINWGDVGIANFFINNEALKQLDFDKVLYNWDCY